MLVLDRRRGERVRIGDDISVVVVSLGKGKVRLGFDAPADVPINREELYHAKRAARTPSDVFTTGEIARICRAAPRTVSKWCDTGALECYRIPDSKHRRVTRASLIAFLEDQGMPVDELLGRQPIQTCESGKTAGERPRHETGTPEEGKNAVGHVAAPAAGCESEVAS